MAIKQAGRRYEADFVLLLSNADHIVCLRNVGHDVSKWNL
jgi:hypothetical protein